MRGHNWGTNSLSAERVAIVVNAEKENNFVNLLIDIVHRHTYSTEKTVSLICKEVVKHDDLDFELVAEVAEARFKQRMRVG